MLDTANSVPAPAASGGRDWMFIVLLRGDTDREAFAYYLNGLISRDKEHQGAFIAGPGGSKDFLLDPNGERFLEANVSADDALVFVLEHEPGLARVMTAATRVRTPAIYYVSVPGEAEKHEYA